VQTFSCPVLTGKLHYSTFLAAGHDTSAKALVWYFYAIAKHPEAQARIREEISLVRATSTGEEFSITDLNSMAYTLATLKVEFGLFSLCPCYLRRSIGVYEARPHHLDNRQDSNSGRRTSVGFPNHDQIGRTTHINSHQKRHANRYFSRCLQSVNLNSRCMSR
jgi:hypothetical protein